MTEMLQILSQLADRVEERLKRRELKGKTVQLMIRYSNRKTITRSRKLDQFIDDKETIMAVIKDLLTEHWSQEPVRLLGVTVQDLLEKQYVVEQLDLFTYQEVEKKVAIRETVEQLKEKFGEDPFVQLEDKEEDDELNEQKLLRTSFQKDFLDDYRLNDTKK